MADLPSAAELTKIATLLVPGLIILGIRTRFKEGAVAELKDRVVGYGVASATYYAVVAPLFHLSWGVELTPWLWALSHYYITPLFIGLAIVWFDQSEWFYTICSKAGFRLAHHIPAAWDYAFSKLSRGTFVWVKLNSGTEYAGKMGRSSFASSSTAERDLYLEEVWTIEDNGPWKRKEPKRGVLLCGKDIQRVEIFTGG
ncbi:DUF6338 family protein [Sphingomonas parapaucimobilis]|uniref:DUF6338 family protein n=1 Tax=Sphingomonas parapaucimobilis TaxID=28213 RepID=UPI00391993AE